MSTRVFTERPYPVSRGPGWTSPRGVAFERYDQPGIKTDERGIFDSGRFRAAWVKDPDGNTLALTEAAA
jgi:hypothetical protein